jgi:hypothetical protein
MGPKTMEYIYSGPMSQDIRRDFKGTLDKAEKLPDY